MGGDIPPTLPPATDDQVRSAFVSRWWPRRRTWILLGRTLGGFGAFLAALIAAAQFAFRGDEQPTTASGPGVSNVSPRDSYAYAETRDANGVIRVELPTAWGNRDGSPWRPGTSIARLEGLSVVGEKLVASTNVTQWQAPGDLSAPGAFVGASRVMLTRWRPADLAHAFTYDGCSFARVEPVTTTTLVGSAVHSSCDGSATRWITLAGTLVKAPDVLVLIQAKIVSQRDQEAFTRLVATLDVVPR
jgi:hypothetical protein